MQAKHVRNNEYTEEELLSMSREEATAGLNERQIKFCEYYIEGHNCKMALTKAGYGNEYRPAYGTRLLAIRKVQIYVQWLKARAFKEHMLTASDVLDEWIRIAFADMTDFVDIYPTTIRLKPASQVDGQLIKSIKSGRDGISIELHDKMKALDNLAKYMDDMPLEWKQKIENRKLELLEQEFELKKKYVYTGENEEFDDEFLNAIKGSVEAVWDIDQESQN